MSAWYDCCLLCVGRNLLFFLAIDLCSCVLRIVCCSAACCSLRAGFCLVVVLDLPSFVVCCLLLVARCYSFVFVWFVVWFMRFVRNVLLVVYRTLCVGCSVLLVL